MDINLENVFPSDYNYDKFLKIGLVGCDTGIMEREYDWVIEEIFNYLRVQRKNKWSKFAISDINGRRRCFFEDKLERVFDELVKNNYLIKNEESEKYEVTEKLLGALEDYRDRK